MTVLLLDPNLEGEFPARPFEPRRGCIIIGNGHKSSTQLEAILEECECQNKVYRYHVITLQTGELSGYFSIPAEHQQTRSRRVFKLPSRQGLDPVL